MVPNIRDCHGQVAWTHVASAPASTVPPILGFAEDETLLCLGLTCVPRGMVQKIEEAPETQFKSLLGPEPPSHTMPLPDCISVS